MLLMLFRVRLFFYIHNSTIHAKNQATLYDVWPDVLRPLSLSFRQCSRPPHLHFPSTFRLHRPHFSISIYMPAHINRLQDYCSPIDKFKIISKFVQFITDSSSHSPKQVRLLQTPDIPFGSSPRPRRHTASPASRTRASAPAG